MGHAFSAAVKRVCHSHFTLDRLLYAFSAYWVPVALAVISVVALVAWDTRYPSDTWVPVQFRVFETSESIPLDQAVERLSQADPVSHRDTKLSEAFFWLSFQAEPLPNDKTVIELPSRHALEATCWESASFRLLGQADRAAVQGKMRSLKAGFAIEFGVLRSTTEIVCRTRFSGPARLSVMQWPQSNLAATTTKFYRDSGLLEGGLAVLSIFVVVTALINREWIYVLFAAWLLVNLRLAQLSAGWDLHWLDRSVPTSWLIPLRQFSLASYFVLTITLFSRLFREDLRQVGQNSLLQTIHAACFIILIAAVFLPYRWFLPCFWTLSAVAVAAIAFLLARILLTTRSKVAMWYAGSIAIAVSSNFYEVIAAALGVKGLIGAINSVSAALSSSLLAALAIAEQMRQTRHENEQLQAELRSTYEAVPSGLFTLDDKGLFLRANRALSVMLKTAFSAGKPSHWSEHFEPGSWERLKALLAAKSDQEMEIWGVSGDPADRKCFLARATLEGNRIEGSLQDITERTKATEKLHFLAEHDSLTATYNRRGIERILSSALSGRDAVPVVLAYLDLDRFKLINDLFGHPAGDEVLKQVCERVKELLTEYQTVGRVGGDEFIIVFRGTTMRSAEWICRGIIERIGSSPCHIGHKAFQVRGSIGLVELPSGLAVRDAISLAERACREAKSGSQGNLVAYDATSPIFKEREEELRMIERLGAPVAPEGLFLVMQPIMSLKAPYESLNFEILLRMREPDNTITPAWKIVSAAERNGRISIIDRWVLSQTLDWLSAHHEHLRKTRFVTMNLSGGSLNDEKFVRDAFSMLSQYGCVTERLCIEITETVALHDLDNTRRFIDGVRSFGAKIALDDFGAGYTSFSYLKELPADAVKIDGGFIKGVNEHPANLAIVEAIVELARNLGMTSIAEWAEDRATVEALAEVGVDYVQGYAIGRPQDPAKILLAESAASFIEDDALAQYLRRTPGAGGSMELWDAGDAANRANLH